MFILMSSGNAAARFVAFVAAEMPDHAWPPAQLERVYRQVLKARKAEYWQSERAKLKAMDNDEIPKAITARQRGLGRNIGRRLEGRWR